METINDAFILHGTAPLYELEQSHYDSRCTAGWVAAITGPDPARTFARTFVAKQEGGRRYGPVREGGIYEYRKIYGGTSAYAYNKGNTYDGFGTIRDGKLVHLKRDEVLATFAQRDNVPAVNPVLSAVSTDDLLAELARRKAQLV